MKRILKAFIILMFSAVLMGAAPINYDYNTAFNITDLKAYIDQHKIANLNNVFCIGQDKVLYYMNFSDTERDYPANPVELNNIISEQIKTYKTNTLQIRYEHDSGCYLSPVVTNESKKQWQDITAVYNTDLEKWQLLDNYGQEVILINPAEQWRGEVTVYVRAKDTTGIESYDKYGVGVTKFRIHKAPVPIFSVSANGNLITLDGTKSYDYDGSYKNLEGNYSLDKGIKAYEWAVMINDEWKVIASAKTYGQAIPKLTYNTNGQQLQDYRLTVMDYDGAYASVSKGMLVYKKPIPNFSYTVAGKATEYSYLGNAGRETVDLADNKAWNDDNFNELYPTSGARTEVWTSTKGLTANNINTYSSNLFNSFNAQLTANKIGTTLYMKNKYDLEAEETKYLTVKNISITDESSSYYNLAGGFKIGTEVIFQAKLSSDTSVNDWTELRTELECDRLYEEKQIEMDRTSENTFYVKSSIPIEVFGDIPYTYKVYSNRTNELIAVYSGKVKIEGEAPIPYLHYTVANNETAYAHKGNINHETVGIFSRIDWKDTGTGIRTEEWKAVKTGEIRSDKEIYVNEVLNSKFNSLISDSKINTQLTAANIYSKVGTASKELYINNVTPNNQTAASVMAGTEVTFKFTLNLNTGSVSELNLKITSDTLGLYNEELTLSGGVYSKYQKLKDIPNQWKDIAYTIDLYSNRTGELIGTYDYTLKITTPITITGYINGIRDNIELITDEKVNITAQTNKYAEKAEVKLPIDVIDARTNTIVAANTYISMDKYEENKWKVDIIIPSSSITDEATIQTDYLATSFNQRDTATDKLFPKVITIKILEFRVKTMYDIYWKDLFLDGSNKRLPNSSISFDKNGKNSYTNDTDGITYYNSNPFKFGYLVDFEIDTIGLFDTDTLCINVIADSANYITGLNINSEFLTIKNNSSFINNLKIKNVIGNYVTWEGSFFLPYTNINDREYDSNAANNVFLPIKFKIDATKNSRNVTYFETTNNYATIFNYYLKSTCRDDIFITNAN